MAYGRAGCKITGGTMKIDGVDLFKLSSREINKVRGTRVAYVAQSAAASFNPAHKIGDQVIEVAIEHKLMSKAEALDYAGELLR